MQLCESCLYCSPFAKLIHNVQFIPFEKNFWWKIFQSWNNCCQSWKWGWKGSVRWNVPKTFRENDRISTVTYWQLPWGYLDPPPCRFPSTTPWSPSQTPWLTTPAKSRSRSTNLMISRPIYLHRRVAGVDLTQVFVVQKVVRQLLSVAQALQTFLWTLWKEISYFDMIWSK